MKGNNFILRKHYIFVSFFYDKFSLINIFHNVIQLKHLQYMLPYFQMAHFEYFFNIFVTLFCYSLIRIYLTEIIFFIFRRTFNCLHFIHYFLLYLRIFGLENVVQFYTQAICICSETEKYTELRKSIFSWLEVKKCRQTVYKLPSNKIFHGLNYLVGYLGYFNDEMNFETIFDFSLKYNLFYLK